MFAQAHWMAFAVAQHLAGHPAEAVKVIDQFSATVVKERAANYEESEMMLYKGQLLEEQGLFQEALDHLDECKKWVVDKLGWLTKRAELLLFLGLFNMVSFNKTNAKALLFCSVNDSPV
jgi:peptide alpha-N-acetyltransferase